MTQVSDVASALPPDGVSYGRRLTQLADAHPDTSALVFAPIEGGDVDLTWSDLERLANRSARAMAARGLGQGDLVALALPNSPTMVAAVFGAWKLGAVPVPARWDLPDWERERLLEVIDAKLSLSGDDLDRLTATTDLDDAPLPDRTSPHTHGICSSGSTGTPKVILMEAPSRWLSTSGGAFAEGWIDVPRPQTVLLPTTLYHTNGFATMNNLLSGDRLVMMQKFDAARVVDLIERHRVTNFTATPTMLQRIADLPGVDDRDLSSIVWMLQGAAVIPPSLVHRWIELVGAERFYMAYGMTEALGLTALRADEWLDHPGSVGTGYRETEIRILDPDGNDLPPGEIGEIYLRSPLSGYYRYLGGAPKLPETADGFGTAGDLGRIDEDGFLYIADRRSDMIITGGANVYPAEVESALIEHPGIADVVVIGLADEAWGRRVHAVIEASDPARPPGTADVIAYAKGRLAGYKVPKTVEVVDRLPRSEASKISRAAMVEARGG